MDIINLGSSSSGNCYILKNEQNIIMVEAGLDFRLLKTRLLRLPDPIILSRIDALLITHEHGDHSKAAQKIATYCPCIGHPETLKKVRPINKWPIREWESIKVGTFHVRAFKVDHDVPAYGFIIKDVINEERLLFVNDTAFLRYDLSSYEFDYVMIECNHIYDLVAGDKFMRRKVKAHLSLDGTIKALKSLDLSKTRQIYLMHMSDGNSDQARMIEEVEKATGKPTVACLKHGGFSDGKR